MNAILPVKFPFFLLVTASLIYSACGPGGAEREYPAQGTAPANADPHGVQSLDDLRLTYCRFMKILYGGNIKCLDGGRAFLDDDLNTVVGVVFDGDFAMSNPPRRHLLCLQESATAEGGSAPQLDAISFVYDAGNWKEVTRKEHIIKTSLLESIRTLGTDASAVAQVMFLTPEGNRDSVCVDFRPSEIVVKQDIPVEPVFVSPTCLGAQEGMDYTRYRKRLTASKAFFMTGVEQYLADNFELMKEKQRPVQLSEDSIARTYQLGSMVVDLVQLIAPMGEQTSIRFRNHDCPNGLTDLYALVRQVEPRLRPFSLNLRGTFGVVVDHEDFRVVRKREEIINIRYDSFMRGEQVTIEMKQLGDDLLLELSNYYI
ncbi:MAG: hypothetical protein AAGN35_08695 [Bacteroidota bacterium]